MRQINKTSIVLFTVTISLILLTCIGSVYSESLPQKWTSQRIYVPIYSHIFATGDATGGWGANFIVEWSSKAPVTEPITDAIFLGTRGSHSYSFSSQGKVLSGH